MSRRVLLRASALGAVGTAFAGTATGCGDSGSSNSLSFTYWGSTFEKEAVATAASNFEDANSGSEIEDQHIDAETYQTKMNTLLAANQQPDIGYMFEGLAMRLAEQGKLVNILRYEDKHPQIADMLPGVVHQWAPGKAINQLAVEMMLIWYNVEMFKEAGVSPPPADPAQAWSWDDYVSAAERLTIDRNGKHPTEAGFDPDNVGQWGTLAPTGGAGWYGLLRSNGADLVDEDGTKCTLDSPEAVEVLQNIADLMYEHRVAPTPTQSEAINATSAVQLKTRRVAMIIDGHWQLLDLGKSGFEYGVGFVPKFQEPLTANLCSAVVAFANSEHKEQAVEFLLYLADPAEVSLYADGLWMPLQRKYYTDQKLIDSWTKNAVHPEGFDKAAIDGMLNYSVATPAYRIKNGDAFTNRYSPPLDKLWTGKERDAKKAAAAAVAAGTPQLRGVYPGSLQDG